MFPGPGATQAGKVLGAARDFEAARIMPLGISFQSVAKARTFALWQWSVRSSGPAQRRCWHRRGPLLPLSAARRRGLQGDRRRRAASGSATEGMLGSATSLAICPPDRLMVSPARARWAATIRSSYVALTSFSRGEFGSGTSGVGIAKLSGFVDLITAQADVGRSRNRVGVANAILASVKYPHCFARACAAS